MTEIFEILSIKGKVAITSKCWINIYVDAYFETCDLDINMYDFNNELINIIDNNFIDIIDNNIKTVMMKKFIIDNEIGYDKESLYKRYNIPILKTNSKKRSREEISNYNFFIDSNNKIHITDELYEQIYSEGYDHLFITFKNIYPDKSNNNIKYIVSGIVNNIMDRCFINDNSV